MSFVPRVMSEALFGVTGDLESFAVTALQIYTLLYPLVGFQIVGSSYFQSSGQPLKAAILEMTRQVIFLIPLILILPLFWGIDGILFAAPVADFFAMLAAIIMAAAEFRNMAKLEAEGK